MDADLKNKTALVWDYGKVAGMMAERLAREFGRVLVCVPWEKDAPKPEDYEVASGIPGVEKVDNIWNVKDQVDVFVFCHLYQEGVQKELRSQGKRVWGLGSAEEWEINRWKFRQWLETSGLPTFETERVVGIDALSAKLKDQKEKFVKISKFRGIGETFEWQDFKTCERYLIKLKHDLGAKSDSQEFIIDEKIDGIEIGYDGFTVDGQLPAKATWGIEIKDAAHVETASGYFSIPEQLQDANDALSKIFAESESRGFFATEVRITEDGTPYFTDPCFRAPFPPIEGMLEIFKNWGEIIYHGAGGDMVDPEPAANYFALGTLESDYSIEEEYPVEIEKADIPFVKLPDMFIHKGTRYVLPRRSLWPMVGRVVGLGHTAEEAIEDCHERAKRVKGLQLDTGCRDLDEAKEIMEKLSKRGIDL